MSGVSRWRDSGHLERAVETAGGQEAFDAAVTAMLDDARGWRLAAGGDAQAARDDPGAGRGADGRVGRAGLPDRKRRRLHPGRAEPVCRRTGRNPQARRRLRRRAAQTGIGGGSARVSLRAHSQSLRGLTSRSSAPARPSGGVARCTESDCTWPGRGAELSWAAPSSSRRRPNAPGRGPLAPKTPGPGPRLPGKSLRGRGNPMPP
jgi:hypothetical protein